MKKLIITLLVGIVFNVFGQNTVAILEQAERPLNAELRSSFDLIEAPLLIKKGKLLLAGTLEGENGYFILDTGAPTLVINRPIDENNSDCAYSINRDVVVQPTVVQTYSWGGLSKTNAQALAVDLSHLESALGVRVLGLLGYEELRDRHWIFDFKKQKLYQDKSLTAPLYKKLIPKVVLPFKLEGHLPVVQVDIGSASYWFAIDTGAARNLLGEELVLGPLQYLFSVEQTEELQGLDQEVQLVRSGRLEDVTLGHKNFANPSFLVTDLAALHNATGLKIDGLLGYPFFEQYTFSIDYKTRKIFIW
jgi:hypothetical protein